jgi:hypothetical protein
MGSDTMVQRETPIEPPGTPQIEFHFREQDGVA